MTSQDSPGKSILHTHRVLVPSGITVPLNYWLGLNHWGQQISGKMLSLTLYLRYENVGDRSVLLWPS